MSRYLDNRPTKPSRMSHLDSVVWREHQILPIAGRLAGAAGVKEMPRLDHGKWRQGPESEV